MSSTSLRRMLAPSALIALVGLASMTTGCATLIRGKTQELKIESAPSRAKVWVDGTYRGETPISVTVDRNASHTVKLSAEGHEDVAIQTDSTVSGGYVVLNLLFTGGVGLLVDAITGAWSTTGPQPVRVLLSPAGQDCSTGDCDYLAPVTVSAGGAQ